MTSQSISSAERISGIFLTLSMNFRMQRWSNWNRTTDQQGIFWMQRTVWSRITVEERRNHFGRRTEKANWSVCVSLILHLMRRISLVRISKVLSDREVPIMTVQFFIVRMHNPVCWKRSLLPWIFLIRLSVAWISMQEEKSRIFLLISRQSIMDVMMLRLEELLMFQRGESVLQRSTGSRSPQQNVELVFMRHYWHRGWSQEWEEVQQNWILLRHWSNILRRWQKRWVSQIFYRKWLRRQDT